MWNGKRKNWIGLCLIALGAVAWSAPARADVGYLDMGSIVAWGNNDYTQVTGKPWGTGFTQVSAGARHGLALDAIGTVYGWGDDEYGQVSAKPSGTGYTQVAGGFYHSLALTSDGCIAAWGRDSFMVVSSAPSKPGYRQVAAGYYNGLALNPIGEIAAWGDDAYGQVAETPSGSGHTQVAAGDGHCLALTSNGIIIAWGRDDYDQVGHPPRELGYTRVAGGANHSLALSSDGGIVAWGRDDYGQVSGGPSGTGYTQVAGGLYHSLALTSDGRIAAWGGDNHGQVSGAPAEGCFLAVAAGAEYSLALKARTEYDDLLVTGTGLKALLQRDVTVEGNVTIETALTVLNNPTINVGGTTTLASGFSLPTAGWSLATNDLVIDTDANVPNEAMSRVQAFGSLIVSPGRVLAITHTGFCSLPGQATVLNGSAVEAPAGIALGTSQTLRGRGDVRGPVSGSAGSTIEADGGDLELGDSTLANGFATFGVLRSGMNTVTLRDDNRAYLGGGSLTSLGTVSADGNLIAANGLDVAQGATITGRGLVNTPNDAFHQLVNNGSIQGDSMDHPITLAGYVKGVGTYDNVVFTGTHSPGFSPTQEYVGSVSWGESATLIMELGGTEPGAEHDQIVASGALHFDGTLDVSLIDPFKPAAGDAFTVLTYGSRSGKFAAIAGWDHDELAHLAFYNANDLTLHCTYFGDANLNGKVDGGDYTIWADHYKTSGGWREGDFTGDGQVDGADYTIWADRYGSGASGSIPEPASAAILIPAIFLWLRKRRGGPAPATLRARGTRVRN